MCVNPLHIRQNASYKDGILHPYWNEVPCGECAECRNSVRNEWLTRISFELQSLYRRGGVCVLLTFTYNDLHLPVYRDGDFCVPCFNHKDVKTFLNRLKVKAYRRWSKNCYRYFFVSEYGKYTQRPHYHCQFYLAARVDYHEFIELCRELWSSKEYGNLGYLFPKYDASRGCYIDNKKRFYEPRIRSLANGARYVSKYITKDISYYGIPEIAEYLKNKTNKWKMRNYLPKHWQSNGLGYSIVDYINLNDDAAFRCALDDGIYNPVLGRLSPLPKYFINKLMYRNVRTDLTSHTRVSFRTGKILYDRELTRFGREYQLQIFNNHVKKYSNKMSIVLQWYSRYSPDDYSELVDVFERHNVDVCDPHSFGKFAIFHEVYKNVTDSCVVALLHDSCGDTDVFTSGAFKLWLHRRDVSYLRDIRYSSLHVKLTSDFKISFPLFADYYLVDRVFCYASSLYSTFKLQEREQREARIKAARDKFRSRFDINLC